MLQSLLKIKYNLVFLTQRLFIHLIYSCLSKLTWCLIVMKYFFYHFLPNHSSQIKISQLRHSYH